ncbi:MAG: ubiquitin-conjugating enzyme E2 variant [Candidatus Heimdallarchaeaceae archaeon]
MPIPDAVLSREAQLMFQYTSGFEPKNGDLTTWRGFIPVTSNDKNLVVEIEARLPDNFPRVPPEIYVLTPITHPNVDSSGKVSMRILSRWRYVFHLFQVIIELRRLFSKVPPTAIENIERWVDPHTELNLLYSQKEHLQSILSQKREELNKLKSQKAQRISSANLNQMHKEHIEDELLKVENELFAIEQQFDNYDISSLEFAKKFLLLKKRYYLLNLKLQ